MPSQWLSPQLGHFGPDQLTALRLVSIVSVVGRELYDFLADSFFFDEEQIANGYASISRPDWEREIKRYLEHMISNGKAIARDVLVATEANPLSLLFSKFTMPSLRAVKQGLLYFDRLLLPAPWFLLDRQQTSRDARFMKDVTPMVAAGLLAFLSPGEWPGEAEERQRIDRWRPTFEHHLRPTVAGWLRADAPRAPESKLNAATEAIVDLIAYDVTRELPRARLSGSMVALSFRFAAELLRRQLGPRAASEVRLARLALRLKLPCVDSASIGDIASVRMECGRAFVNFRTALRRRLSELREIDDPARLEVRLIEVERELTEGELSAVENEIRRVSVGMTRAIALGTATLGAALYVGSTNPFGATLLGMAGACSVDATKALMDLRGPLDHPGYFLWKLSRRIR